MPVIDELAAAARQALEAAAPSIVRIGRDGGRGCGIVVADGEVVTNAHNLRGEEVTVAFPDGRCATGTAKGLDADGDLVVISVDTAGTPPITWSTGEAAPGDVVFAVARTAGGGERISFGIVSGTERSFRGPRGRRIKGSLEHTAPLPRGSSGSPVVAADGSLVALNTNRLGDGYYLALPADEDLRARLAALASGQHRSRRRLGVGLAPAHVARALRRSVGLPERDGLLVRALDDGGPAASADLRVGDLLVAAGGQPLATADDLLDVLDGVGPEVALEVVRGTESVTVTVRFPDPAPR